MAASLSDANATESSATGSPPMPFNGFNGTRIPLMKSNECGTPWWDLKRVSKLNPGSFGRFSIEIDADYLQNQFEVACSANSTINMITDA